MRLAFLFILILTYPAGLNAQTKRSDDFFIGKWFAKPEYEGEIFLGNCYPELEISVDGAYTYRIFLITKDNTGKEIAGQIAKEIGFYNIKDKKLFCMTSSGEQKMAISKLDNDSIQVHYISESSNMKFYNKKKAPWSNIQKIIPPEKAEQGAAANP